MQQVISQRWTQLKQTLHTNKFRIFLSLTYSLGFLSLCLLPYVSLWWLVAAIVWCKIIELFGHHIGMHRYFSHRSFQTQAWKEKFLACMSILLGIGSPLSYVRNHRHHHRTSDTAADPHTPHHNHPLSIMFGLWQFKSLSKLVGAGGAMPRDHIGNTTLRYIHDNYYKIWMLLTIVTLLISWKVTLYLLFLPTLIYYIGAGTFVNWGCHCQKHKNKKTKDNSCNNTLSHYWTMGEGLHNNHHADPSKYDIRFTKDEPIDITGVVIRRCFLK